MAPPSKPPVNTSSVGNTGSSGSVSFPPFTYNYNPAPKINLTVPAPYNLDLSEAKTKFTCTFCNTGKEYREQRAIYGKDGYSTVWVGCLDCFHWMVQRTTEAEQLRKLLAQAAAYVQVCHEGGDWDLLDGSSQTSAALLEIIRTSLCKPEAWNPSQERRNGKL